MAFDNPQGLCFYHNSHLAEYRSPFGAVPCGQAIKLRLSISAGEGGSESLREGQVNNISGCRCLLRVWEQATQKKFPMNVNLTLSANPGQVFFETVYLAPQTPGLIWYDFVITDGLNTYQYGNNADLSGGAGRLWTGDYSPGYQITVFQPKYEVPKWFKQGIVYQIFIDRFCRSGVGKLHTEAKPGALMHLCWEDTPCYLKDSDGKVERWNFFGGNLQGVISKLDYLEELGVSVIYFNPIFEAASNHRYDTADYYKIDPLIGTQEDFQKLITEAKRRGIRIILDGVFSHTGSDSRYFNRYGHYSGLGAYQSKDSPYYDWYQFDEYPDRYACWWGNDVLPEVREMTPSYRDFIFGGEHSVVRYWMRQGVKGWRLDVADELPDQFIRELRDVMHAVDDDAVLIGEVWEDASNKISYDQQREYFYGGALDAVTNYPFRKILLEFLLGKVDSEAVQRHLLQLYENYPRHNFYSALNIIGSHDTARILTLLGEAPAEEHLAEKAREKYRLPEEQRRLAVARLKLLSLIQFTFPGVPCIYYGDEAGLEGYSDPYNRGTFPWGREDEELLGWYKRLSCLRREYSVLSEGGLQTLVLEPDLYGFVRTLGNESITVIVNRHRTSNKTVALNEKVLGLAPGEPVPGIVLELLTGRLLSQPAGMPATTMSMEIPALEAVVIYCKQAARNTLSNQTLVRSAGILLHPGCLPSKWGIGDLGQEAYAFVDFLAQAGQSLWQVLPLNPVDNHGSPYLSESAFAGYPLLISLEQLKDLGLLAEAELVHVTASMASKEDLLRKAFENFSRLQEKQDYNEFVESEKFWLEDYCLYKALKKKHKGLPWQKWERALAAREKKALTEAGQALAVEIGYQRFLQYVFHRQWQKLKSYANRIGIRIIGDMPIYVAADSCDTWAFRHYFKMDRDGAQLAQAGVPPDCFSSTGQLWGNPLYDWCALRGDDYSWWKERFRRAIKNYDTIRLDHFRAFESFWEVGPNDKTAVSGRWLKGPGKRLFSALEQEFTQLPIIAEDLGVITPEVENLMHIFQFPGMQVLQFTREEPLEREKRKSPCVYYTGTHDNDTLLGWVKSEFDSAGVRMNGTKLSQICKDLIETVYMSDATWVIVPLQDVLGLDSEARINTPGTAGGNWQWVMPPGCLSSELQTWLERLARKHRRNHLGNDQ
ncbi:4-alpha-glucanotransferase [Pelotomaculum isophthalicicum JI]|uniref:4-alpha-glucanotransferase n=1 Tax=Pelotomaculum isophthalicicum JI TaxID=947010 RepID=A0A9X4JWA3_9FIRM|nr:4-alpha-glucanotransferase [Pelotomaculum isophthalicicum]MDF9408758.1 4-alpha-glucanotransferase [Pelotomaculum isophthalicicum JI]